MMRKRVLRAAIDFAETQGDKLILEIEIDPCKVDFVSQQVLFVCADIHLSKIRRCTPKSWVGAKEVKGD